MQVSIESQKGLERRMRIVLPPEKVDPLVNKRLQELQKSRMRGFRAGKIPKKVVMKRFGKHVLYEIAEDLMRTSLQDALKQEELDMAGMPRIEPKAVEIGQPLEYTVEFEIYPEIELKPFEDVKLIKHTADITDEDLQETLDKIRKQHSDWEAVAEPAANGHRVVIDFEGRIDGEAFEGGRAEEFNLELGTGNMIPGFEEALLGVEAGQDTVLDVTFPEDYHHADFAGKAATFAIHVHRVEQAILPELDDALAEKLSVDGGIEGLRKELRDNMTREMEKQIALNMKNRVFDKLVEDNDVDVPKSLIAMQIQQMRRQAAAQMGKSEEEADQFPAELFEEEAKKQVHMSLLLRAILKQYDISLDEERLQAKLDEELSQYPNPDMIREFYQQRPEMMDAVKEAVLEDQAVEKLLEQANIVERKTTYLKVMKPRTKTAERSAPKT